ncbi:MAG TPA: hypothetical protein PLZ95_14495 [Bryobacteraceae bacterium]|nr:hypothetical protein [Bryobacteraceae bacterium]
MAATSTAQPVLTEQEWDFIALLLSSEQDRLIREINHSVTRSFRHSLHDILSIVESLLARIPRLEESSHHGS